MKEIQGKSTLVWVSARFELARVRVIGSQLYYVEQTKLLTRFRKDFTSSVWNFCCWGADIPSGKISLTVRRKERWLLSASQKGAERKGPKWLQINFYIINPKNYLVFQYYYCCFKRAEAELLLWAITRNTCDSWGHLMFQVVSVRGRLTVTL